MAHYSSILIFGNDATLLETRRWILERAGFEVFTVSSVSAAKGVMREKPLGLSVLCHTLSPQQREDALKAASTLRPQMRKLSFFTDQQQSSCGAEHEEFIENFVGAEAFVAASRRLLQ